MQDLEFVRKIASGDRYSCEEFLNKYSRLIYNYILNTINSSNSPSLQSCVQDIFHDLFCSLIEDDFRRLKSFKGKNGCSLASWLRQVTINFTIDYLRKLRPSVSIDAQSQEGLSLKDSLAASSLNSPEILAAEEKTQSLEECIEALDADDKFFIELHINKMIKLNELKDMLGVSRGAIDMMKSRIVAKLRDCFKSKGFALDFG